MKPRRKQTPLNERALTNVLLRELQKSTLGAVYAFVDRDTGAERHTRSGFDFLLVFRGKVLFCEAKRENALLTPYQTETKMRIEIAQGKYAVVRYRNIKSLSDFEIEIIRFNTRSTAHISSVTPFHVFGL